MRACGEPRTMSLVELSLHAGMDFVSLRSDGNVVAAWSVQPMALLAHALAQLRPSVRTLSTRSLGRSNAPPVHRWQSCHVSNTCRSKTCLRIESVAWCARGAHK